MEMPASDPVFTTEQVISAAHDMPIINATYHTQVGTSTFRFYRLDRETWVASVHDNSRPVSNLDERSYTNPTYLRGFMLGRISHTVNPTQIKWMFERKVR